MPAQSQSLTQHLRFRMLLDHPQCRLFIGFLLLQIFLDLIWLREVVKNRAVDVVKSKRGKAILYLLGGVPEFELMDDYI